jgi:CHAT domain-containing protein/tetratricopeptide (TPR) repeat protein
MKDHLIFVVCSFCAVLFGLNASEAQNVSYIGLTLEPINGQYSIYQTTYLDHGSAVLFVLPGGPADRAGLRAGDIIVNVDGREVRDVPDTIDAIKEHMTAAAVEIHVLRSDGPVIVRLETEHLLSSKELSDRLASLRAAKRFDEAVSTARELVDEARSKSGAGSFEFATALDRLFWVYTEAGRDTEAKATLSELAKIIKETSGWSTAQLSDKLLSIGAGHMKLSLYAEAEQYVRRALSIRLDTLGDGHVQVGWARNSLGYVLNHLGRHDEALLEYRGMARVFENIPERRSMFGYALRCVGEELARLGRYEEAERELTSALAVQSSVLGRDHLQLVAALGWLARVKARLGREDAASVEARVLNIIRTGDGSVEAAGAESDLADVLSELERYGDALKHYQNAAEIIEKNAGANTDAYGLALGKIGEMLVNLGRDEEAENVFTQSLIVRQNALGLNNVNLAGLLSQLVGAKARRGKTDGLPIAQRLLELRQSALGPEHIDVGWAHNDIGFVFKKLNMHAEALFHFKRFADILMKARGPADVYYAFALGQIAQELIILKREGEAEVELARAVAVYQNGGNGSDLPLAWTLMELGRLAENRKNYELAVDHYKKAVAIVWRRRIEAPRRYLTANTEVARTRYVFQNFVRAAYLLRQEQGGSEDLAAEAFRAAQWIGRSEAEGALLQMSARFAEGPGPLANLVREEQDLRTIWLQLEHRWIDSAGRVRLNEDGRAEFEAVDRRLGDVRADIEHRFSRYASLIYPPPVPIDQLQTVLTPDEALVLYNVTEVDTYVWIITKQRVEWQRLYLTPSELQGYVRKLRCGLDESAWWNGNFCEENLTKRHTEWDSRNDKPLPFDVDLSRELYERLLFRPFEHLLEGKDLLIVPSGALTELPFQVLITEAPENALDGDEAFAAAAWLARKHAISVLPSVSSLISLRQYAKSSEARRPYIGFANPLLHGDPLRDYDVTAAAEALQHQNCEAFAPATIAIVRRGATAPSPIMGDGAAVDPRILAGMSPLPDTAEEICVLGRRVGAEDTDLFLGARDREDVVRDLNQSGRLSEYRVLHFATHGLVAGEEGVVQPGLVFTPPDVSVGRVKSENDGYLTASEITQLQLDADLVILSACNTASSGRDNQALSGLASAFLYAGARSVLVSHWSVDSFATTELMAGMTDVATSNHSVNRAKALQAAMLEMIHQGGADARPEFWAPFALVGEPSTVH